MPSVYWKGQESFKGPGYKKSALNNSSLSRKALGEHAIGGHQVHTGEGNKEDAHQTSVKKAPSLGRTAGRERLLQLLASQVKVKAKGSAVYVSEEVPRTFATREKKDKKKGKEPRKTKTEKRIHASRRRSSTYFWACVVKPGIKTVKGLNPHRDKVLIYWLLS